MGQRACKLLDCTATSQPRETELFIVEGDSASIAVGIARDHHFQAVLPMQGKPLNAWKAKEDVVARNEFFAAVIDAIGAGWGESFDLARVRYTRIVLLFDPDADGIHCGALMLMFFFRWMKQLLDDGRLYLVRPPMFELEAKQLPVAVCVMTEQQAMAESARLVREGYTDVRKKRFRGLAGLGEAYLKRFCIQPETRHLFRLQESDAIAAIQTFSPNTWNAKHP